MLLQISVSSLGFNIITSIYQLSGVLSCCGDLSTSRVLYYYMDQSNFKCLCYNYRVLSTVKGFYFITGTCQISRVLYYYRDLSTVYDFKGYIKSVMLFQGSVNY